MENKRMIIEYCEYDGLEELPQEDRELMLEAMRAAGLAYAPYSHFSVGAAVRMEDGSMVRGSNQENMAYPSGLCAERTALFGASVQSPKQPVVSLAVVGRNPDGEYVEASPCGACRQVMAEMEGRFGKNMVVFCYLNRGRIRRFASVSSLLPFGFEADL